MAIIVWNEKYTVRIKKFDDAHQKIIDMINKLFVIVKNKGSRESVYSIVTDLEDYTIQHFSEEELEMERTRYPGLKEHKAHHKQLIEDLEGLKKGTDRV